jgi:hypothetical protein
MFGGVAPVQAQAKTTRRKGGERQQADIHDSGVL